MTNKLPRRQEVALEKTWDLTTIFTSDTVWEEAFVALQELVPTIQAYKGKLILSPKLLLEALELRNHLMERLAKLYVYAHLQEDGDTTNTLYQAMSNRAMSLYTKAGAEFAYFNAELMEADPDILQQYLVSFSGLEIYQHEMAELLARRKYILSEKEEAILAKGSEIMAHSGKTFSILNNADLVFPTITGEDGLPVQLSHGLYGKLMESSNRQVRVDAFKAVYKTYTDLKNTFATTLTGSVKKDNFSASVRGYHSARHKALFNNSIPETVYDALIVAVNDHLPLLHRYVKLRKRALKLDTIHMYDLYVPMVEEVDLSFSYEQAKEMILAALSVLGKEYTAILEEAFANRWIDHVENKGKRSGAYSSGTYGTNPYILMNWQDSLDNVYTLAHELGHSVHSYYTRKHQPFIYGSYSIFLAEVASTTNENLLTAYLLEKFTDKKIRAYIINHYLDGVKGTVFRQTQFAQFEYLIHNADSEGVALTSAYLTDEYFKLNAQYYGQAMTYDEEIGMEWARIPHFYYNYYVYQYATGFSAASALSAKILTEGQPAITAYLDFLKAGCSDYPINVLQKAGVDMTTNAPIIDALKIFEQRLTELEVLL
ncbi:MAG: oligoendopeptidase F [Culicoidibacterales bacterium]